MDHRALWELFYDRWCEREILQVINLPLRPVSEEIPACFLSFAGFVRLRPIQGRRSSWEQTERCLSRPTMKILLINIPKYVTIRRSFDEESPVRGEVALNHQTGFKTIDY